MVDLTNPYDECCPYFYKVLCSMELVIISALNICHFSVPVAPRSKAARLLRSWVRIPPGAWMFFCCGCCVLSGRGLCDELITRPEKSYRLWCVVVCDLENRVNEEAMIRVGSQRHRKKILSYSCVLICVLYRVNSLRKPYVQLYYVNLFCYAVFR